MLQITKYLLICIVLVSDRNINASKLPEDCDYGDCGQAGYFASGSAYSSQVMLPDGSVVTNSKGSSLSSDGVQRSFHELKQEADKYVTNDGPKTAHIIRNEYAGRLPILKIPQIQGMPDLPYMPPSAQSELKGSSQYSSQQQYNEEQKQSSNINVNMNPPVYQQAQPSVHDGYQSALQQEAENAKVSGSGNPVPNSDQQTYVYYPTSLDVQPDLSDSNVVNDNKLTPSSTDGNESTSSFAQKIISYMRQVQDTNANIPPYWLGPKANTFTIDGVSLAHKNDEVYRFLPNLIPPVKKDFTEKHYNRESYLKQQQPEHNVDNPYVDSGEPKMAYHVKLPPNEVRRPILDEQSSQYVGGQNRPSKITVGSLSSDGRRSKLVIKIQAPSEAVDSSQTFRRESNSQSVIKSNDQPLAAEMNSGTHVRSVLMPPVSDLPQNDAAALPQNEYINFPILLRGEPQNVRIPHSKPDFISSTPNQIYESKKLQQSPEGINYESASNNLNVPDNSHVAPQNVDKSSSSFNNVRYFSTDGKVGELLVPNSDIYVPADADIVKNRIRRQFSNSNANLSPTSCPTCPTLLLL